jgi:fibro-slime domain-containing protein
VEDNRGRFRAVATRENEEALMLWSSRLNTTIFPLVTLLLATTAGCGNQGSGTSGFATTTATGAGGASTGSGSSQGGAGGDLFSTGSGGVGTGNGPSSGAGGKASCDPLLVGIIRDFKLYTTGGHPDFEHYSGAGQKGIVKFDLGPDHKPVYAPSGPTANTTGKAEFDQWYRDVPGVNFTIPLTIPLTADAKGIGTYDNEAFFPIDDQGWGNEGLAHNFGFTYELHMVFQYSGGEVFSFTGDDDLWVFINNRLAIDLGGLHPALSDTLDVDAQATKLGIIKGQQYALDLFQAERHSEESHFKVQSSLNFTNCDPIIIPQ